jgi:peptide methionine sulfoxide reductase MsrA
MAYFFIIKNKKSLLRNQKKSLKKSLYKDTIVTEIIPFRNFMLGEDYHKNTMKTIKAPHCNLIIDPKLNRLLN